MAQENDINTKFSTLNVNAMEFVPSFASSGPVTAAPAAEDSEAAVPPATVPDSSPTDEELPAESVPAAATPVGTATPTEVLEDKSPDNPGKHGQRKCYTNLVSVCLDVSSLSRF